MPSASATALPPKPPTDSSPWTRPDTKRVTARCTSSAVGPFFRKSARISSIRLLTSAGSTPGRTIAIMLNMPTCEKGRSPADTCTASFSCLTRILSSRDEASPPRIEPATTSEAVSGSFSPGTAQLRLIMTAATRSFISSLTGAGSVGMVTVGSTLFGPGWIAPKYFSTNGLAVATSMSPASTSTALFGP